jgi:transposase
MADLPMLCCACAERDREIAKLKKRNGELETENRELRKQLDEALRSKHRQTTRFPRNQLKKRRKRPGRKKGHDASHRPTPTPDQVSRVIDVPAPTHCPCCKDQLVDRRVVVQYQTDLPPIVPIITQFNVEVGTCPRCGRLQRGKHEEQTSEALGAANHTIGPVALTMAAEMKHHLGVPYRKICDFFQTYCDLHVAPATLVRAEQRLTTLAQPTYELLVEALRLCHVIHADETGWRIGRVNAWLWVFTSKETTIYVIRRSRGHEVPEEILGDFDGYLIVDGLKSYDVLDVAKGRCNGHLLRRCKELEQTLPKRQQHWARQLKELLQDALALAQKRDELTAEVYAKRVQQIEDRLDDWLDAAAPTPDDDVYRLVKHVASHRAEWLVFLRDAEVPATNNHAERMIRPAVITRKVGGCNKTLKGAAVHGVLASLIASCRQQGRRFLDLCKRLWTGEGPQAIKISELPGPTLASASAE